MQLSSRSLQCRNLAISWTVVVWLTTCVDVCALHMSEQLPTPLCIALLQKALPCFTRIDEINNQHSSASG